MATHRPITLLHISDIQVKGQEEGEMLNKLLDDLGWLASLYGLKPALIVASGDLAQEGKKDEFQLVANFLKNATNQLDLKVEDIIIVPGNHDINWESCKKYFSTPSSNPPPPYKKKWNMFIDFFEDLYGASPPPGYKFTLEEPWTLYEIRSIHTVFAGLNSTWRERHSEKTFTKKENMGLHYGCIETRQFKWFVERLENYKAKGWLRIAVLHHNVDPGVSDDSSLKDVSNFNKYILPHVNLILHGHTHQSTDDGNDEVPILSTGSASVAKELLPMEVPNQYQIIQIWQNHYQRWTRSYSKVRQNWIGDCSISTDGNSWHVRKTKSFKLVDKTFPSNDEGFSEHARGFIEAGDSVTAAAVISCRRDTEALADPKEYFSLRQKFGVYDEEDLELLDKKISEMTKNEADLRSNGENKDADDVHLKFLDLQVVRLKLHSQEEKFDEVADLFAKLIADTELKPEKQRGIIHRQAIYTAIKDGFEVAKPKFLIAQQISDDLDDCREPGTPKNEHSPLTTRVLRTFAEFFCNQYPPSKEATQEILAKAQQEYLGAGYVHSIGQAFPVKSAIQTLFAEAAVFLYKDLNNLKGLSRLFAANLLISRYVITPNAEGYKEQLSMIHYPNARISESSTEFEHRKKLRNLLEEAMDSGSTMRRKFLDTQLNNDKNYCLLRPMWEIFELIPFQCPQPNHWQDFRDFLTRHDQDMSVLS